MIMDIATTVKNLIRVGVVSTVDYKKRMARVVFHDKQDPEGNPLVSGWLMVLQNQPLIAIKKWKEDKSVPGEKPDEIEKIDIEEEANPKWEAIYHSVHRELSINEKYGNGKIVDERLYEVEPGVKNIQKIRLTEKPDFIKETEGEKTLIKVYPWLPYIEQTVVCLYLPTGESDGFVIGGL
jgi:hypothetical protein